MRCRTGREKNMPEVVVYALGGRSVDQKRALCKDITDAVVKNFKVEPGSGRGHAGGDGKDRQSEGRRALRRDGAEVAATTVRSGCAGQRSRTESAAIFAIST